MICYLLTKKSLAATQLDAISWNIPIDVSELVTGQVVVTSVLNAQCTGDWLYIAGQIYIITKAAPDDIKTTLSVQLGAEAFNRPLLWDGSHADTCGALIIQTLAVAYYAPGDTEYAMQYLRFADSDSSALIEPDVDKNGFWTASAYIRKVRRSCQIALRYEAGLITVTALSELPTAQFVPFDDGHTQLKSQTYSSAITAKVTVYQDGIASDFYLAPDGTVTATPPTSRVSGAWTAVAASAGQSAFEAAQAVFSKNKKSHKIEFWSDRKFSAADTLALRLNDSIVSTSPTEIWVSSEDTRYRYVCGSLPVTLTDKILALGG